MNGYQTRQVGVKRAKTDHQRKYKPEYYEKHKERNKRRMKNIWDTNRKLGFCGKCGDDVEINPRTGKKKSMCEVCRFKSNRKCKEYYDRRKNETRANIQEVSRTDIEQTA